MTYERRERDSAGWSVATPRRDSGAMILVAVVVIVFAGGAALITWAALHNNAVYADFMSGCEQDHKHYECILLWRASRRDDALVLPPVVISTSR